MKRIVTALFISALCHLLFAFPIRIQSWNIADDVKVLNAMHLSIDDVNHNTGSIIIDVKDMDQYQAVLAKGFAATILPDETREYFQYLTLSTKDGENPMQAYYSIDEYHAFMQNTAAQYPNICQIVQWGTSGQNRPLYYLKISDNVTQNEAEPELKYTGGIHADETVGYDMMIRMIQLLTSEYTTNPRITNLVNNTEIWICPMMNPDGYVLGQRYNAAGIDLNRNFPMPTGEQHPDGNPTAIENIAMMDFSAQHNFVIGATFHGGALVINYPWDYTYTLAPDDALLRSMSLTYSIHNTPMYNSTEFAQGITNGAAWYVITGGYQDWNYFFTSNMDLTAEISNIKWPAASTLDTYWAQNKESILAHMEYAQNGVKGLVTNASGNPIAANITVAGNTKIVRNDPVVGDYHRILLPGTYTITASASGMIPQTAQVTVPDTGYITTNFTLEPAMLTSLQGMVRDASGIPISGAVITLYTNPVQTTTSDANGLFGFSSVYEGDYTLTISADEYALFSQTSAIRNADGRTVYHLIQPIFEEDFEGTLAAWTVTSPWAIVTQTANAVLTDSPAGNYSNNANRAIRLSNPVSLQNISNPALSFMAKWALEDSYDFVYIEGSTNGIDWVQIGSVTGTQNSWTNMFYPLDSFAGSNFYLRFRLRSDRSQTADGIYIDNVMISGRNNTLAFWGDANLDGVINNLDTVAVLNHAVGNSLIPAGMINADVDGQGGVITRDAYLIQRYCQYPDFRFPNQSGTAYPLPVATLSLTLAENVFVVGDTPNLFSLYMDFPCAIASVTLPPNSDYLMACDNASGKIAMVSNSFSQPTAINLIDNPSSFTLPAQVNDVATNLDIVSGTANSDLVNPAITYLEQNYPNPFNPSTSISFSLPESCEIRLDIFNVKGQIVKTLAKGAFTKGTHTAIWKGQDMANNTVANGLYYYKLSTPTDTIIRKMVLSK